MCMRKIVKRKHVLSAAALVLASAAFLTLSGCAGGEDAELTPALTGGEAELSADGHSSLAGSDSSVDESVPASDGLAGSGTTASVSAPAFGDPLDPGSSSVLDASSEVPGISPTASSVVPLTASPAILPRDWSSYFGDLNGAAVLYDPEENTCQVYNEELADTRRSPCSTFKIISSLTALERGVLDPEDSVRPWSRETFWNSDWNRDIGFSDAFRTSCVWYFRALIDDIGPERMQEELDRLQYGNCDISDWEGRQNTNNNNRALTGFWIESSLKISPMEQVQVLERIFGSRSEYSAETVEALKQVMFLEGLSAKENTLAGDTAVEENTLAENTTVEENAPAANTATGEKPELRIYGKTGMGKANGVTVDAWFTGFADCAGQRMYFCVYLGETPGADVTSTRAREIAVEILSDEWQR